MSCREQDATPGLRAEGATPSWWSSTPVHMPWPPNLSLSPRPRGPVYFSWVSHSHRNLAPTWSHPPLPGLLSSCVHLVSDDCQAHPGHSLVT